MRYQTVPTFHQALSDRETSLERPGLAIGMEIQEPELAGRLKQAAGWPSHVLAPREAIVLAKPDLLDRIVDMEPQLALVKDLLKIATLKLPVMRAAIDSAWFAFNLAKVADVFRDANTTVTERGIVVIKAGLSGLNAFLSGTTATYSPGAIPDWVQIGENWTKHAGLLLTVGEGLYQGKPAHEIAQATWPDKLAPLKLGLDLTKLLELAASPDPTHADVAVVASWQPRERSGRHSTISASSATPSGG